jgi:hypothetical protein
VAKKINVFENLIGADAAIHCMNALDPYKIDLKEYLRSMMVKLLETTDEARTDIVDDAIRYQKIKTVEVRKKSFTGGQPIIERIQVDVRAPEEN